MSRWKSQAAGGVAVAVISLAGLSLSPASGAIAHRPTTGVGSCTLKGWNPEHSSRGAEDLPVGKRFQTYKPDNYNCTGAVFAKPGVEFRRFPQPKNFHITNQPTVQGVREC